MNDLLHMSFTAAVMILIVIVVRALFIHKLPKMTFVVLWGIVVLRLLIPFSLPSSLSIYTWINRLLPNESAAVFPSPSPVFSSTSSTAWTMGIQHITAQQNPAISPISIIWLVGMVLCVLFYTLTYLKCRREFQTSLPVHHPYAWKWLNEHKCSRTIQIRQSDLIRSPLTYGMKHPVILLPKTTDWNNVEQLQYVLMHELVHIRRWDQLTKLLFTIVLCIHWFNPLVWVMYMLANRDLELSCDERVVKSFGESTKRAYAMTLITMEERKHTFNPLSNHFSKNATEERIVSIMKIKKTSTVATIVALALIVSTTTVFATTAAKSENPLHDYSAVQGDGPITSPMSTSKQRAQMKKAMALYEKLGLIYDEKTGEATYLGKKVRQFYDEIGQTGFSHDNGDVDIDAVYTDGELSGLRQGTQAEFDARTQERKNIPSNANSTSQTETAVGIAMARNINGTDQYSTDGGKTWLSHDEYNQLYPSSNVVWWTYDEYKAWLDQEKKELQQIIGSKGRTQKEGWFVWTQERVDEAIARYELTLEDIKNGTKVSKTVDGADSITMTYNPDEISTISGHEAMVTLNNGSTKSFGPFDSEQELLAQVKAFCEQQVRLGNVTQQEADKILNQLG